MALCGVCSTPNLPNLQVFRSVRNSSIGYKRNHSLWQLRSSSFRAKSVIFHCSSSLRQSPSNVEEIDDNPSVSLEDESAHVMQFKWSDFRILDRVSIGHGGRVLPNLMIVKCFLSFFWISFSLTFTFLQADELVFEAIVQVPDRSVSKIGRAHV